MINPSMTTSAQTISSLDYLLEQILLRLPVKSLIRYRSVSKHWPSLITDPDFFNRCERNPTPAVGVFYLTERPFRYEYMSFFPEKSLDPPPTNLNFAVGRIGGFPLRSCTGLLYCLNTIIDDSDPRFYRPVVYNPSTRKRSVLPKIEARYSSGMTLAFDPLKSPHYKIVCVQSSENTNPTAIRIYSSETGEWRFWGQIKEERVAVSYVNGVYWNGSVHWISCSLYHELDDMRTRGYYEYGNSLRFDVENEVLHEMPSPPPFNGKPCYGSLYFGESCDHLHYINADVSAPVFDVYEMNRDYSEWFVKFKVDLSQVAPSCELMRWTWHHYFSIISLVRGERDEDLFIVLQALGKAIKYNLVDGSFGTIIHDFGKVKHGLQCRDDHPAEYIECLCDV